MRRRGRYGGLGRKERREVVRMETCWCCWMLGVLGSRLGYLEGTPALVPRLWGGKPSNPCSLPEAGRT